VLFMTFWRRQNSLAPAGKFLSKNIKSRNVMRQKCCTCLSFTVGAICSVHLSFLGLNILKMSVDELTFYVTFYVLVFTVFCVACAVFFVMFHLCIFNHICFASTSVRTTTTE
jgi:hypothetical protein